MSELQNWHAFLNIKSKRIFYENLIINSWHSPSLSEHFHGSFVASNGVLADTGIPLFRVFVLEPIVHRGIPHHDT